MNASERKFVPDPDLPRPGWGGPVDLVRRFETPDGIPRTLACGTYPSPMVAQEAAQETYGVCVWTSTGNGTWRSAGDEYAIQPVRP